MANNQPVPVEACSGWLSSCSFCQKRFSEWTEPCTEDDLEKIPSKPGIFMFALDSKQRREIVALGVHKSNIRIPIQQKIEDLKQQISQKKFKETKSSIFFRWAHFPNIEDKEVCSILTHWYNYGTLPRLTKNWPGLDTLQNSSEFTYSDLSKKWCYKLKDPVWRKPKTPGPAQAVTKCKGWSSTCAYCDGRFTVWLPIEEALNRKEDAGGPPSQPGLCMFSAICKGQRQVVLIKSCANIKLDVGFNRWIKNRLKMTDGFDSTSQHEVRWMTVKNLDSGDVCLVYAHFLNYRKTPILNEELPGEDALHKAENFVFRHRDQQWCYQEEKVTNPSSLKKNKGRRRFLLNSLSDELHNSEECDDSQFDETN